MALPFFHIMIGIGVGVLGFLLLRPRQITNNPHRSNQENESYRSNNSNFQTKDGETCVICFESMMNGNMKKLKCGHALHKSCYERCLYYRYDKCPTCRRKL